MKKIVSIILAMMLLIGVVSINAFAAGGLGISTGSLSLKPGANGTVTVSASNCAGTFSVSSSNPSVATASASTDWLDNDSATISISAKAAGTAVITVTATDMATYDEENITGQARSITVTVAAPAAPATTTTKAPEKTSAKTDDVTKETTTKKAAEKAELGALKVIANNDVAVTIVPGTYDYDIKVPYGTKSLTVDASALDDATVEVIGNDNISDGSVVNINVTSKDGIKTVYSVKVAYEQPEVKQVVERDGVSKGLVIIIGLALFFVGLIIGLLLGLLIGKKKYENVDYFGGDDGYNGGFVSGSADDDDDGVASPFQTSGFNFESAGGMGLNYDFANDDFEDSADDDAVSLRDPVYAEPAAPFVESADEPVNIPPVAPVIPVAEPVAAPAPVVEPAAPVAEPAPAYVAPEPAYAAPAPAYAPAEPVAPVAEPAPTYVAPTPAYAAPVVEPVASEPTVDLSSVIAPNPAAQAPVVEPVAPEPVAEPTSYAAPVTPVAEPVAEPVSGLGLINSALNDAPAAPVAEPVAPVAEPVATPYIDDEPPVLPYEAGKTFGSVPFEQSAD